MTARLVLRAHAPDDFAACGAMWRDPLVTRFLGGQPSSPQRVWLRMLEYAGLWSFLGYGYWAVAERSSGAYVGDVGFADFHRDGPAATRDMPEIGWALASAYHGRGYATEAIAAALAWGDERLGPRTVCLIDAANAPSLRLAEKFGYERLPAADDATSAALLFERHRALRL